MVVVLLSSGPGSLHMDFAEDTHTRILQKEARALGGGMDLAGFVTGCRLSLAASIRRMQMLLLIARATRTHCGTPSEALMEQVRLITFLSHSGSFRVTLDIPEEWPTLRTPIRIVSCINGQGKACFSEAVLEKVAQDAIKPAEEGEMVSRALQDILRRLEARPVTLVTPEGPGSSPAFRPPVHPSPSPPLQKVPFAGSSPLPPAASSPALASSAAMLPTLQQARSEAADGRPSAEGRPQKEVPADAISGKPVEGTSPLEEEMHAFTWPGCTRVFSTLSARCGHISSHKPGKSKVSDTVTEAGTGRPEQQESQNAASLGGEGSREKGRRTEPVVEVQLSGAFGPHHHPVRLLHSPENAAPFEQPVALLPSNPLTQERPLSRTPDAAPSLSQKPGSREPSDPDESIPSQPSALMAPEDTCENRTVSGEQKPQPTMSSPPLLEALRLEPELSAKGGRLAACTKSEVSPPYSVVTARAAGSGSGSESKEVSRASNARPRPKADWSQLFKKPKLNLRSNCKSRKV